MTGKQSTGLNVGGSSILVIFVLLCLTTFATLSMVSANADYKLTLKTMENSQEYYLADAAAEALLGEIDAVLLSAHQSSDNITIYHSNITGGLMLMEENISSYGGFGTGPFMLEYAVPINEQQELAVVLEVLSPSTANAPRYHISKWMVVNTAPLAELDDDMMNLWTGQF